MTAVHNSGRTDDHGTETGVSAPAGAGLPELCRRAGGAAVRGVVRGARAVRWYMSGLMGDGAYDVYVAHQRRTHPDAEPLTERQFWRQKMDDQDRNPGARCC